MEKGGVGYIGGMVERDELASDVYAAALARLGAGLPAEVIREIPEIESLMGGYWAMIAFLAARPAMVVGNVWDPNKIMEHMRDEQREAQEVMGDKEALCLELADAAFFGLVVMGLLWESVTEEERAQTKEIVVWSITEAKKHGIELQSVVPMVAKEKNPENYLADFLQIRPNETVGEVMVRLPGIYQALRQRRQIRAGTYQAKSDDGYHHASMRQSDARRWGRYDS